jgi:sterol desaturase/sphingolipid hydroxylase (fatty acid hydroxylase superfamily)
MWELIRPILEFKNPVVYAIPFFLIFTGIEAYLNYKERSNNYVLKDSIACISMGIGSLFIDIIAKSLAFVAFTYLFTNFGFFKEYLSWTVLGWILLFFLDDITFYWHHRLSHEIRILWAAHVNHHSSVNYNLSTAVRQSWTEILYKYIFFLWLPLVGFDPIMVLTQISINLIFQFWIHTKIIDKMPFWFEFIFNSPSHHRVHHASNVRYLDRNHAGTLIIWDRMFGTFAEEKKEEAPVYGITSNINTYNPLIIATHEYGNLIQDVKKAPTFMEKLKYIFYPPGWSHDGKTKTANELRKELKAEK